MTPDVISRSLLDAAVDALPADSLAEVRRKAAARFAAVGFPTIGQEDWKYTNLSRVAELSIAWLKDAQPRAADDSSAGVMDMVAGMQGAIDAHWIVVSDGVPAANLPDLDGIVIERLATSANAEIAGDDALSAFNVALLRDGLRIRVSRDAAPNRPIAILHIDDPANRVSQSRLIVEVAENARAQIVECALSASDGEQFSNSVIDVNLARGAKLDLIRIQDRSRRHSGVHRLQANLDRDAVISHNSFDFGGDLTRNDIVTNITGAGASVTLNGLYLAAGEQHIDNHTTIVHGVGPSHSNEEYRGILTGLSRCVFNGKVIVAAGADGTDSRQSNHNLLLSSRAEIDTKPELEIYADDVKCAHGATVGQLDAAAMFYLRSRGLNRDQAQQVLTRAFAAGTLSTLSIPACHDLLAERLDLRLADLVGELDD